MDLVEARALKLSRPEEEIISIGQLLDLHFTEKLPLIEDFPSEDKANVNNGRSPNLKSELHA